MQGLQDRDQTSGGRCSKTHTLGEGGSTHKHAAGGQPALSPPAAHWGERWLPSCKARESSTSSPKPLCPTCSGRDGVPQGCSQLPPEKSTHSLQLMSPKQARPPPTPPLPPARNKSPPPRRLPSPRDQTGGNLCWLGFYYLLI